MEKYTKAFRIVQLGQGVQAQIIINHNTYESFEDAENDLKTWDPNENQTLTIIPIYIFKKKE